MNDRLSPLLILLAILATGCQRTEEYIPDGTLADYHPFQIGASVTYRLDSTVYISNQSVKTIRTHVIRLQTDAMVTDGEGRTAYRIIRSIRDPLDSNRWTPDLTCLAVPGKESVEWIAQNQRFIIMAAPVREDLSWKGNRFINTVSDPERQYLDGWNYTWRSVGMPFNAGDRLFSNTVTVDQRNDSVNDGRDKSRYFSRDIARDVFARGVGLIYRERLHEVWQPPNALSSTGYYEPGSYGIRLTYLSHKVSP